MTVNTSDGGDSGSVGGSGGGGGAGIGGCGCGAGSDGVSIRGVSEDELLSCGSRQCQ